MLRIGISKKKKEIVIRFLPAKQKDVNGIQPCTCTTDSNK